MSKTWIITGASSGFGRGLTEKLLARGDRVAATTRKVEALADLQEQYGDRLWSTALDLRELEQVHRVVDRAFAELGYIDYMVSNAGYGVLGAAEETTDLHLRDIVDTNLLGSIALIRSALPHFRAQGGGRVLQVSSEGGQIAYPGFSLYHATKWGIEGFVESVAQEVATFGIKFMLVEPGPARTNFVHGVVQPEPIAAYDDTPAHDIRDAALGGDWVITGNPGRMVDAMIVAADMPDMPLRLVLGGSSYTAIREALTGRISALDAQRDIALSTDYTAEELA